MRAKGYYWILIDGDWEPAHWSGESWYEIGMEGRVNENRIATVGPKLEPPVDL